MAYRKKTLRSMSPTTRKVARLIGELDSIGRRLKNVLPEIRDAEFTGIARKKRQEYIKNGGTFHEREPATPTPIKETLSPKAPSQTEKPKPESLSIDW